MKKLMNLNNRGALDMMIIIALVVVVSAGALVGYRVFTNNDTPVATSTFEDGLGEEQEIKNFQDCMDWVMPWEIVDGQVICTAPGDVEFKELCENVPEVGCSFDTEEDSASDEAIEEVVFPSVPIPTKPCSQYVHDVSGPIAESYEEVVEGVIGEWRGCIDTPWTEPYKVDFAFLENGRYVVSNLSQPDVPALYWGTANSHPSQTYTIDDYQDNGFTIGSINVVWPGGTTVRNFPLTDILLTGNSLSLQLDRADVAGPLVIELVRLNQE